MAKKGLNTSKSTKRSARPAKKDNRGEVPDALTHYMNEISKLKPLAREEEEELSRQIKAGDAQAMHELVRRNLKYVVTVANKYRGCGLSLQDLIEEGNIGLIQAAKRFDGERHVKFITYAVWWIRQAIMHALAEQAGTVKLPIKQAGKLYKIEREYKKLTNDLEREPTTLEVAEDLGYKVEDIESIMRAYRTYLSLDTPLKENETTPYLDLLENPNYIPYDDQIMRDTLRKKIDDLLHHLSPREEKIIRMRFGFDGDPKTLEEIGQAMGLSRERVRQIEKRAKMRLKVRSAGESLQDHLD
ncbi:RNA polymerase sigma factor [Nitrospina gracilis 3/211]|uniref:RNA polymerase sigma factor n=1 Tax=Nitrospina gracilis (strain 3/211) TaxID=1266370 RepID=M1YK99_NITG3|nr:MULTISPECIES: RNA polymerase sigma factor RpoD/SigA [Nitrospina]MCF8723799.1 RNA polymerase primary sigma factor [Nitrospina sp. Nb-3]CCQ90906.1 RNA polymerase sigma factor [Nitrospina gracilis 3/211]